MVSFGAEVLSCLQALSLTSTPPIESGKNSVINLKVPARNKILVSVARIVLDTYRSTFRLITRFTIRCFHLHHFLR